MDRRNFVQLIGTGAVIGVAGCASGPDYPGADATNVSVAAEDTDPPDALAILSVEWNTRAQSGVDTDTDDIRSYSAEDGQKVVVTRVEITNEAGASVDLSPRMFRLRSSDVEYNYMNLFGPSDGISDVSLDTGGSYGGLIGFLIPEEITEAQLVVHQAYDQDVSVSFSHNEQMPINMSV